MFALGWRGRDSVMRSLRGFITFGLALAAVGLQAQAASAQGPVRPPLQVTSTADAADSSPGDGIVPDGRRPVHAAGRDPGGQRRCSATT